MRTVFLLSFALLAALPAHAQIIITEVYYCHGPTDDQYEWVELFNASVAEVSLDGFVLAHGGLDYSWSTITFGPDAVIEPCGTFVVGGPESVPENALPVFDLAVDFDEDLQNGGAVADGVALFAPGEPLTGIPVDAVLWGDANTTGLLDELGLPGAPDVGNVPGYGISIARVSDEGDWIVEPTPNPNTLTYIPEICRPIDAEERSWGAVKALLRD